MKFYITSVVFLFITFMGKTQINESDTTKFQLKVSSTGNYQQGNVEVLTLKSKLDFSYLPIKELVFKSQNNSLYQEFYKKEADNDIYSRNYLYYKPQNKVYPFGIAYVSTNYRRDVNLRTFEGIGVTWQLLEKQENVIKLSASGVYESTTFKGTTYNYPKYNGSNKINLWRGTFYLGGWNYLLQKKLRFFYDAYWQPALNDNNNYRTQADIGLDFPVWRGLSFNALYTYTHENVVIAAVKQEDKILTFGMAYNLKVKQK